ncbi:hypothetical protein Goari_019384 [Gossypium aridum]|uniref:Aminotransferase-like plant mobile domain-containing protein n=1 Tax=Gossypium aridum TaxID=34290 RepID=A0A7J8WSJ0_GOSAI|nr:hypothetical protein [Gossypium aridum]
MKTRDTHSIFSAVSVQLHSRTLLYNLVYWWMGQSLQGYWALTIRAQFASKYWQGVGQMPYTNLRIQEGIPNEFLENHYIWNVKELDELHKIDLRGRTDENWLKFYAKYIYIWEHKLHGKPYLLPDEERSRQHHRRRPRRPYMNIRPGVNASLESSLALTLHEALMGV